MPKTTKLHELLPAESSLEQQSEKTRKDLIQTFEKKRNHFEERLVTFIPNTEGAEPSTEEQLAIQTTVKKELAWWGGHLKKALDASLRVADANTRARADITLDDGKLIAQNVPATALLELEKRVAEIHALVGHIPTLDPSRGFTPDTDRGEGIFKGRDIKKERTKKVQKVVVLHEPTKEHPAQTQLVPEDIVIGVIQEQVWSGLITSAAKAEMLDRCEQLLRAVKQARARANEQEVDVNQKIGDAIVSYVFG